MRGRAGHEDRAIEPRQVWALLPEGLPLLNPWQRATQPHENSSGNPLRRLRHPSLAPVAKRVSQTIPAARVRPHHASGHSEAPRRARRRRSANRHLQRGPPLPGRRAAPRDRLEAASPGAGTHGAQHRAGRRRRRTRPGERRSRGTDAGAAVGSRDQGHCVLPSRDRAGIRRRREGHAHDVRDHPGCPRDGLWLHQSGRNCAAAGEHLRDSTIRGKAGPAYGPAHGRFRRLLLEQRHVPVQGLRVPRGIADARRAHRRCRAGCTGQGED